MDDQLTLVTGQERSERSPAEIMFDALTKIAHSHAFFDETKKVVEIARQAITDVHNTYKR